MRCFIFEFVRGPFTCDSDPRANQGKDKHCTDANYHQSHKASSVRKHLPNLSFVYCSSSGIPASSGLTSLPIRAVLTTARPQGHDNARTAMATKTRPDSTAAGWRLRKNPSLMWSCITPPAAKPLTAKPAVQLTGACGKGRYACCWCTTARDPAGEVAARRFCRCEAGKGTVQPEKPIRDMFPTELCDRAPASRFSTASRTWAPSRRRRHSIIC